MNRICQGLLNVLCSACICCAILGCKDGDISISDGEQNTSELNAKLENIDVAGYKGLEDVISNNVHIQSDSKPIMLIFGVNNCKYCEILKQDMRENKKLHDFIKDNFATYYINTSYSKTHEIAYMQKSLQTDDLARYYGVVKTPLIVWLESDGTKIMQLDGYNGNYFSAMLLFVKNKGYGNEKNSEKRTAMFIEQYTQSKLNF
ncbi:MAG: thioredoxin fold domain-containing protein [Helicobacter trogontum]|uniref:Thioredoxin-like fold domain-containing protein n=1 Tax=Helicobacter trogontum TaxID=50960 RepID=A0ABQ0D5L0_9HELI|nr:thioredoxin fold domain-containing protein [Helicobacter trogontum]MCI5787198.1 thioredoxin fold domain-containing protein [Helicobacter trogontum]